LLAGCNGQERGRVPETETCNRPRIPIVIEFKGVGRKVRDDSSDDQGRNQADQARKERTCRKSEHAREHHSGRGDIVRAKENPADHNKKERGRTLKTRRHAVPESAKQFVKTKQNAVIAAPKDKRPVGAVPETAEKHGDQNIAVDKPVRGYAAASERNVEIIAQAGGKRNVPSTPEIGDVERFVRRVEILREADAEKIAKANGHVAVAGEIEIDLVGVAENAEPRAKCGEMRGILPGRIDYGGDGVGEKNFFHHADGEEGPADIEPAGAIGVIKVVEIGFDLAEADDGPGNELRKKRDVTGELPEVARRRDDAAIGVDHVADRVKSVERNADRKNDVQGRGVNGHVKPRGELGKAGDREIEILEKAEQEKIDGDRNDQEQLAAARIGGTEHAKACKVADRGGEGHEGAEFVVPRAVKNIAGDGEPDVALPSCAKTPEAEVNDR